MPLQPVLQKDEQKKGETYRQIVYLTQTFSNQRNQTMSVFDPDAFMQTQTDSAMDTVLTPVPPGDRQGQIDSIKVRQNTTLGGDTYTIMDVNWHILDDESKKVTGMAKPTCRQSVFLDLTTEGSLDNGKGKNIQLGRLREAVGQNSKGKKWSPGMLVSATALCHIEPAVKEPENYSNVTKVAKAA